MTDTIYSIVFLTVNAKMSKVIKMDFPTLDADLRPFINRDIRLISKKLVTDIIIIYIYIRVLLKKIGS